MTTLVLASTSRYRRELLSRLHIPFDARPPDVDEAALPGESPTALAMRLAHAKALAVSRQLPQSLVIGSDQVADLDGKAIGKPGTHERALEQLQALSGRAVVFRTAVAVLRQTPRYAGQAIVSVTVRFRRLTPADIDAYLRAETPYDCAGSAKAEGLGIALLESVESADPTALIGLPLIATCRLLREAGLDVLHAEAAPRLLS